jgi:uncharacterized membrane protein YtjA (UPF0391 family)
MLLAPWAFLDMLRLSVVSLVFALVCAVLTFTGLLGGAYWLGRICFLTSLVVFIVSAGAAALQRRPLT